MAYRLLDQNPVYFDAGDARLAGGHIAFYENNTTTPKVVYGDKSLSVNLGASVSLDEEGRLEVDVWLDGAYSVEVFDADDNSIWNRDDVEASDPFPSGSDGQVLGLVGGVETFVDIEEVPDYSGASEGDVLTISSGVPEWEPPAAPEDFGGGNIIDAVLVNVREKTQAVVATATTTIDYEDGAVVLLSQDVNIASLVLQNFGAAGEAATMTIVRTKDATGTARTISWGTILFPGGTDPTLTQTSGAVDVITLVSTNGTQILGYGAAAFS
jgi:hypothetical protein